MNNPDYQKQYYLKQMEMNSLLEITQAINNNMPEKALYKMYGFTIRANLNISKLALYVFEGEWDCMVNFGTKAKFMNGVELPIGLCTNEDDIKKIDLDEGPFSEFNVLVPVLHKQELLAIVFASPKSNDDAEKLNTTFLQALSNLIIVAIENKRLARKQLQEEAFKKEMEIAKNVQNFLFPDSLPNGARLKVEASYLPHHTVGGDYYDYIPINKNQFLICIADVSGKGIPAAIMMSNFQASLRTLVRQTANLVEIVEALNFQILENAKGEQFITFFGAIYDHRLNSMVYINAGHNLPFLIDKSGVRNLDVGTTVLGAFQPLPFITEGFITDLDAFTLFAFTDGVTETENEAGEEFGTERLQAFFEENHEKNLNEIHKSVLERLDDFRGNTPYRDDITLLSCKVVAR